MFFTVYTCISFYYDSSQLFTLSDIYVISELKRDTFVYIYIYIYVYIYELKWNRRLNNTALRSNLVFQYPEYLNILMTCGGKIRKL